MKLKYLLSLTLFISLITDSGELLAQDNACVFCEIAAGSQPSRVVYTDASVVSFLSHAPDNPGHLLVVPVKHARYYTDISDSTLANMTRVAKYLINVVKTTDIKADGFKLMLNSGEAAGQHIKHAHLHIIPRYKGEVLNTTQIISPAAELDAMAEKIRKAMADFKQ